MHNGHTHRSARGGDELSSQAMLHKRHSGRTNKEQSAEAEDKRHHRGAQTFRRGRVIIFLGRLQMMRATLLQQLEQPEYEPLAPQIRGELKALDQVMQDYIYTFELQEAEIESIQSNE